METMAFCVMEGAHTPSSGQTAAEGDGATETLGP